MRKRKLFQKRMTKIENLEKAKVPIIAYWFEFRQRQIYLHHNSNDHYPCYYNVQLSYRKYSWIPQTPLI